MPTSKLKAELESSQTCRACGKLLEIDPAVPGRIRHYCDDKCKTAFHRGKRPSREPSLDDCLTVLADLAEGIETYDREIKHIEKILRQHYRQRR